MYFTASVGCNKHYCFKHLAHRSVKLTFSRTLAKSCGEIALSGYDNDFDHTCTHVFIYINECSVSLYPTVIKNIIKVIFIAYFLLKYDKKRECFKLKTILKKRLSLLIFFQLNYVDTHFVMPV